MEENIEHMSMSSYRTSGGGGEFIKCVGEENQVVKKGMEYNAALGKNIKWKKGKENQYHLCYDIKAALWKNIKWGRGEGWIFVERKSRF
jgi:hypothetical protein